jgi:hypothetical protein
VRQEGITDKCEKRKANAPRGNLEELRIFGLIWFTKEFDQN